MLQENNFQNVFGNKKPERDLGFFYADGAVKLRRLVFLPHV